MGGPGVLGILGVAGITGALLGIVQVRLLAGRAAFGLETTIRTTRRVCVLGAAGASSIAARTLLGPEPGLFVVFLPLLLTGGWLVVMASRVKWGHAPSLVAWATLHAVVIATALVGRLDALVGAAAGALLAGAALAGLSAWLGPRVSWDEVPVAIAVGLATGALGLAAALLALFLGLTAAAAWTLVRGWTGRVPCTPWLLAAGWAAVVALPSAG